MPHAETLALLPEHNLSLTLDDNEVARFAGRRFSAIFQSTWQRLPKYVRRELLHWWDASEPDGPEVEIVVTNRRVKPATPGKFTLGTCEQLGIRLTFSAPAAHSLPTADVSGLIAHELAHAYLESVLDGHGLDSQGNHSDDAAEREVAYILKCWGIEDVRKESIRESCLNDPIGPLANAISDSLATGKRHLV